MKVYVVEIPAWDYQVDTIWSTRELAEKRLAEIRDDEVFPEGEIEEYTVDGGPQD